MDYASLAKKLMIKPGNRLLALNSDAPFLDSMHKLQDVSVEMEFTSGLYDVIILFVRNSAEVQKFVTTALKAVSANTVFWTVYPKGSSGIKTDVSRDKGWDSITHYGFIPVSMVAVDEIWSALHFKLTSKVKKIPRGVTSTERKELVIPADLLKALSANHQLIAFEKMAFTHRKEYVQWIEETKKEVTRNKRIEKAIRMISENLKLS